MEQQLAGAMRHGAAVNERRDSSPIALATMERPTRQTMDSLRVLHGRHHRHDAQNLPTLTSQVDERWRVLANKPSRGCVRPVRMEAIAMMACRRGPTIPVHALPPNARLRGVLPISARSLDANFPGAMTDCMTRAPTRKKKFRHPTLRADVL